MSKLSCILAGQAAGKSRISARCRYVYSSAIIIAHVRKNESLIIAEFYVRIPVPEKLTLDDVWRSFFYRFGTYWLKFTVL